MPDVVGVTAIANLLLLGVVMVASWLTLERIEREVRTNAGQALDAMIESSSGALVLWARHRSVNADELAREPEIAAAASRLLQAPREPQRLLASPELARLRTILAHKATHHEHQGFFVIAPDGIVVASMVDADVGQRSAIVEQRPEALARALRGESVLVPPLRLLDGAPEALAAAPIRARDGTVTGVMALRLDPYRDFSRLTEIARVGESGETYAFDGDGRVLTGLRFADELRTAGLLDAEQPPMLSVRLVDPGVDVRGDHTLAAPTSSLPLTRAAAAAVAHERGHDVQGYRDYRGVRVLGAWMWSDELGIGLVSELDEDEVLQPYQATRRGVYVLVVITVLLSSVLTWVVSWLQARGAQALAEREARLRSILDTAIDGIMTIDAQGHIETLNMAAEAMFGYAADEVEGREISMLVPSASTMPPAAFIARHLHGRDGRVAGPEREVEGRRKDGSSFPLELGLAPLETAMGRDARFTAVLRDVEERKSLEARFLQSQKLQAVGQLAAGVAHDFNNLLMGVGGSARVALNRIDDRARVRQLLEEIRGATATGAAITRQLLTMTRMKEGRPVDVELDVAVGSSRAMLERLLGEDVELVVALGAPGAWLRCGDGHIEQLLINLVVNARDAMPKGGTLEIRTGERVTDEPGASAELAAGPYVVLEVRDTGEGMSEAVRKRIFEPFFTTKEVGKGTGLGLSTVYGIVTQSKGSIEVESELGRGTTFRVLLPRSEASARSRAAGAAAMPTLPPVTVLLVEDEVLVRDTIRHYLRAAGHHVHVASGRREALAICEAHPGAIDVLVTDVVLRGESGADVAADVRARNPAVAVVFMSAHPAEYLWKTGRLEQDTAVLQKPFEQDELEARLRAAVEAARAAASTPTGTTSTPPSEPLTVLLVEDQDSARVATTDLLQDEGMRVLAARNGAEAERMYEAEEGRVIVVTDFGLPDVSGDELVQRMADKYPLRGVVFISGRSEDDPKVLEALGRPHTSFLQKPVDFDALIERIRSAHRAA